MALTAHIARALLRYEPRTGSLTWLPRGREFFVTAQKHAAWNTRYAGREVGCIALTGYVTFSLFDRRYLAHRVIWLLMTGAWPTDQIDHVDHNRANNRWLNLRQATHAENGRNQSPHGKRSPGVRQRMDTQKWQAEIMRDGVRHSLGCFVTKDEAIAARKTAQARMGFHPNHGVLAP